MLKLQSKDQEGLEFDLKKTQISLGRDISNDIVIDAPGISGFHAYIFVENGKVEVVDLGSTNGTKVNESRVNSRVVVELWQELDFGGVKFELVDSEKRRPTTVHASVKQTKIRNVAPTVVRASVAAGAQHIAKLVRQSHDNQFPQEILINKNLSIGRNLDNDIQFDSSMISSQQAKLLVTDGLVTLLDLGSTNGTWVNGKKITWQVLSDGDKVSFDEISYVFSYANAGKGHTRVNPRLRTQATATDTAIVAAVPDSNPGYVQSENPALNQPADPRWDSAAQPEPSSADDRYGLMWLLFSPSGRLPRLPYFLTNVLMLVFSFLLNVMFIVMTGAATLGMRDLPAAVASMGFVAVLYLLTILVFFIMGSVVFVKRVHDMGWPGWLVIITWLVSIVFVIFNPATIGPMVLPLYLVIFIPYLVFMLVVLFKRGDDGPNKYGSPRYRVL